MEKNWTRASDMVAAPSVIGGSWFLLRSRSKSVVVAAGAGADAGDVGTVDVDGDRRRVAGVAHAVDVAGRRETADVADLVLVAADQVQSRRRTAPRARRAEALRGGQHVRG